MKKLSFAALERELSHLIISDTNDLLEIKAGNGYSPPMQDCYFSALYHISQLYGGTVSQGAMENSFSSMYGTGWQTTGVSAGQAWEFTSSHFTATAQGYSVSMWASEINNGGYILTTVNTTGAVPAHAVVVNGVGTNGTFNYFDPSTNKQYYGVSSSTFRTDILSIGVCSAYRTTELDFTTTEEEYTTTIPTTTIP